MFKLGLALAAIISFAFVAIPASMSVADVPFSKFEMVDWSKPGAYAKVADPSKETTDIVERFFIDGSKCYEEDCQHNSVRSAKNENAWGDRRPNSTKFPLEAWYSFEIYFPKNFPFGKAQEPGSYLLTGFKEHNDCSTTYFSHVAGYSDENMYIYSSFPTQAVDTSAPGSPVECLVRFEGKVGEMRKMLGRWTRFEYFVKWSTTDGQIIVYRDGEEVFEYSGVTCISKTSCSSRNYHWYGIYKPNNADLSAVKQAVVYYRNVSRSLTREGLSR